MGDAKELGQFYRDVERLATERVTPAISDAINQGPSVDVEVLKTVARLGIYEELELLNLMSA